MMDILPPSCTHLGVVQEAVYLVPLSSFIDGEKAGLL